MSVALTATACGTSGSADTDATARVTRTASPAPTAEPALTEQKALAQIAHYSKVNNEANAHHNRKLLDTIEDGPLYAMSVADYTQDEGLPTADRETYKPWSYNLVSTDVYIPRLTAGQPKWFAAVTYSGKNNKYARVLVMAEQATTRRWEMVAAVDLDDKRQLPKIALDADGYATAIDATSTKNVAAPVDVLRDAVLDNFATGGDLTGRKVFTTTKTSTRQIKVHDDTIHKFGSRGTTEFSSATTEFPDSYALKTADGGALVVFAHTHTQRDAVAHSGLQIVPDKDDRAWLKDKPSPYFTYTFTCSDVAAVPSAPERSKLIGYACRRTDAEGLSTSSAA
ncbi:hypothetical protein PV416_07970 [Streptomyces ipomoeae]|uniref:hypothetical protein n=1 Tax=Streptomyces ipomoeae TaxID=103232 RepID=UPI0029A3ABE1|nr:hypothetical protein [Streptomyces ipomoeae]MDX2821027.1 hypothetical protein [Streptomyces ipomoeae]MDX2874460.1 hypothetical protein [Streptomyces ipomoeae]